jgi:hypothetical protein
VNDYGGFKIAVDKDGNLASVSQGSRNEAWKKLRVDENDRVYLKAGKHPLAKKDTLIGTIGSQYNTPLLLQPHIKARFMGHTPGTDPMAHVPNSKNSLFKTTFDPDRYSEYRYAAWCEYPDEAYVALMDALYRPRVTHVPTSMKPYDNTFKIHLPYYLQGKSVLFIELIDKNLYTGDETVDIYAPGQKNVEELHEEFGVYVIRRKVAMGHSHIIKIRLDLFGDGKVQLPHEPLFRGTDIETNENEQPDDGLTLTSDKNWIVMEKKAPELWLE